MHFDFLNQCLRSGYFAILRERQKRNIPSTARTPLRSEECLLSDWHALHAVCITFRSNDCFALNLDRMHATGRNAMLPVTARSVDCGRSGKCMRSVGR